MLEDYAGPDGVSGPASTWIISASVPDVAANTLWGPMADTLPKEGFSARLAEIREQLKLLSDYL